MANVSITNPTILNSETSDVTKLTQNDNDIVNGLTDGTKDISVNQATITAIVSGCIPPVGSIIPFYDYNGTLTFNASYWAYCNGQTKTVSGIGSQTLPDLSNRYLVGFGTEGGSDMGSATWATAAVGNASHQIDISHTHTVDPASVTSGAGSAHSHEATGLYAMIGYTYASGLLRFYSSAYACSTNYLCDGQSVSSSSSTIDRAVDVDGNTANESSHTHSVDVASTTSSSSGSATQSIQPRSIRVRFIMRIL